MPISTRRASAERRADPDLAPSSRHGERHHRLDAGCGEQQHGGIDRDDDERQHPHPSLLALPQLDDAGHEFDFHRRIHGCGDRLERLAVTRRIPVPQLHDESHGM
jgi:hypothetical protein